MQLSTVPKLLQQRADNPLLPLPFSARFWDRHAMSKKINVRQWSSGTQFCLCPAACPRVQQPLALQRLQLADDMMIDCQ